MLIYLHKILPVFLLPTGLTLLLIVSGLFFKRRALTLIGLLVLWVSSTPVISNLAARAIEGGAERSLAIDAPAADAIVVLSGGRVVAPGKAAISEWGDANRFYGGVELFKADKAPLLIFTGGWSPWEPTAKPEGVILTEYAKESGVPAKNIVTTGVVVNTEEEAQAVSVLMADRHAGVTEGSAPHILLVTSAFHMQRAQRLFEGAGLKVTPFPVDFKVSASTELGVLDLLPSAVALEKTEMAWREMYGRLFYLLRNALR